MEKVDYPNSGNRGSTEQKIQAIRGYLNELADILNHNFEQLENKIDELSEQEKG